jgi:hypothetical protein
MTNHMKRTSLLTIVAALVMLPAAAAAGPREQRDEVKIDARVRVNKVDAKVQVNVAPHVSREIQHALREITAGIGEIISDVTRDLGRELGSLGREISRDVTRDIGRELRNLKYSDFENYQDRNWRASVDDRQTKTVSIGPNGTLELENFSGDITVVASSGRDVTIDFVREARGRTDADARAGLERVKPEIDVVGTRATVRATYMDRPTTYSVSTDFIVKAPAGTRVVVNSLRADVNISGIKGEIKVTTASGDVTLTDVGGIQEAKTGNGDVTINGASTEGELDAGTLNGDITLTDIKARRISANTVNGTVDARDVVCSSASLSTISGDVIFTGSLAKGGRYEFTSNSGDVRFAPSGAAGYALQATSFTGDITSTIPLVGQAGNSLTNQRGPRRRAATAKVGDGSATVTLQTFSGDISIGKNPIVRKR